MMQTQATCPDDEVLGRRQITTLLSKPWGKGVAEGFQEECGLEESFKSPGKADVKTRGKTCPSPPGLGGSLKSKALLNGPH